MNPRGRPRRRQPDRDDEQVVGRIEQPADRDAAHAVHDRAGRQRRAAEQELHDVLEDHEQAERDQQMVFLRPPVERPQQRGLDHRADGRDGDGADRQQEEQSGKARAAGTAWPTAPPTTQAET